MAQRIIPQQTPSDPQQSDAHVLDARFAHIETTLDANIATLQQLQAEHDLLQELMKRYIENGIN